MNKNWYLAAVVLGMLGTMAVAMQRELGWTILGIISVGLNLFNYLHSGDKTEE